MALGLLVGCGNGVSSDEKSEDTTVVKTTIENTNPKIVGDIDLSGYVSDSGISLEEYITEEGRKWVLEELEKSGHYDTIYAAFSLPVYYVTEGKNLENLVGKYVGSSEEGRLQVTNFAGYRLMQPGQEIITEVGDFVKLEDLSELEDIMEFKEGKEYYKTEMSRTMLPLVFEYKGE